MSEELQEINLSSSALSHSCCILDLYRTVVQGYKPPAMPAKMIYGIAVHKFIEVMYLTGGHIPTAREQAMITFASMPRIEDRKSVHMSDINHMCAVALMTWEFCVKKEIDFEILLLDNKPAVEQSFQIEIYRDDRFIFNWCGTIDRIGKKHNGIWILPDWKTTSSWNPDEHLAQYQLKNSPRGYVLGLKLWAEKHPESILGQIGKTKVGVRIDGIYIKPAINDTKFKSSEVYTYEDSEIEEFRQMIISLCINLSMAIQMNKFVKQGILNGACNKKFGLCNFWGVCRQTNPIVMDTLLKRDFLQVKFNPLAYND